MRKTESALTYRASQYVNTPGFVRTHKYVHWQDVDDVIGWRYERPITVDGVPYEPDVSQTGALFSFKPADGTEMHGGDAHVSDNRHLVYSQTAFDEYSDVEWNPDLRF